MSLLSFIKSVMLLVLISLLSVFLFASPVRNMPYTITQPDGSKLDCFVSGDEYHNWLHDKDNYTIIQDKQTGYYCYATKLGEELVSSGLVAGKVIPETRGIEAGNNISPEAYKQKRQTMFYAPDQRDAPTIGIINNLVVYIRFSDETEFGDLLSLYDGWFNTSTSSVKGYFLEASYNQLTVNTTHYPAPANNYVVSWQSPNPRSFYQPYNASSNPNGYDGDTERRTREHALLRDAINGISAQIPTNLVIDANNDGRVDNVVFIVRGAAGAWSSLLWPHRWSLSTYNVYIQDKRVYDYNFQLQTFLTSRAVGVLCHEFFHSLGAPDLYHYTDNGIDPAGKWDIMEDDENPPQHMTAFMKYKYGDWISSIPTISADGVYTLNPLTSPTGNAYRINSANPSQYYIVEFRKDTGTYESSIPGSGLLVYRIDTSCGNGNADGPPDELYIYRPNGTTTVNGTLSSAHFSSETGRIKIDNSTNPTPFMQDGSAGSLYLSEIGSSAGATMTFRIGAPYINFNPNPYTQSFDATNFPPDGWTGQAISGTTAFIRVTSGTNPSCNPQSGAGMLKFNSDTSVAGSSAFLASPRIEVSAIGTEAYQASFFMYRDGNMSTYLDKIEVYMNTVQNLSGSPILLGTIFRPRQQAPIAATPGWYQYGFELPITAAGSYYAVFKAISASGYNMYLDNLKISKVAKAAINPSPATATIDFYAISTLSWQSGGGNPTSYKLYLGTNNPPTNVVNGTDIGNVLQYTHTAGLNWNTTYYWKIVPVSAGLETLFSPVWTFTTMADPRVYTLPHQQQFDSIVAPGLPNGWFSQVSSTSAYAYAKTYSSTSGLYAVSLPNCLYLSNSSDANADLRLISPQIMVPMNILRVNFSARGGSDGYTLLVGTMNSPTGTFTLLETLSLSSVHQQYSVSLAAYSGSDSYIVFKHGLGGTSCSIYIDDVSIEEALSNDLAISGFSGDVIGQPNTPLSFNVSVTNSGLQTQSAYTVQLLGSPRREILASQDINLPLSPGATAVHTLQWTSQILQNLLIYPQVILANDANSQNNSGAAIPASVCSYIPQTGSLPGALTTNTMPADFFYKNSVSETIYLADELNMTSGTITALAYYSSFVQNLGSKPLKIWLKNTSETSLTTSWLPFDGYSLVFDGLVNLPLGENPILINLDTAFAYAGANLAIRVNRPMDTVYFNSSNHFYYTVSAANPNRSRYLISDNTIYDPTNPSAAGTLSSNIPVTSFAVINYVPLELATPVVSLLQGPSSLNLSWNSVQGATAYKVFASENPLIWPDAPIAVVSELSYQFTGGNPRMFFKIVAVNQP